MASRGANTTRRQPTTIRRRVPPEDVVVTRANERPSPRRRSQRLPSYDYAQVGAYFVTITVHERLCLFGEIHDDRMRLSQAGHMAWRVWLQLPQRFPTIQADAFIVMPNHVHGVVLINENPPSDSDNHPVRAPLVGALFRHPPEIDPVPAPPGGTLRPDAPGTGGAPAMATPTTGRISLGHVIGAYKSLTTVEYTRNVKARNWTPFRRRLWQRNYYEHVVRSDESLNRLRRYILGNPAQWALDRENPLAPPR